MVAIVVGCALSPCIQMMVSFCSLIIVNILDNYSQDTALRPIACVAKRKRLPFTSFNKVCSVVLSKSKRTRVLTISGWFKEDRQTE
jgi:hypothetical protein